MFKLNTDYKVIIDVVRIELIQGAKYNLYDVKMNGVRVCRLRRSSTLRVGLYTAIAKQALRIKSNKGDVSKHHQLLDVLTTLKRTQ